jgi:hypothetical protein
MRLTLAHIDTELALMKAGESAAFVVPFQHVNDALITTLELTDEQRRDIARVLPEIVHNRAQAPNARRTPDAKEQLHAGLTRMVAPFPELARCWAELAPLLAA